MQVRWRRVIASAIGFVAALGVSGPAAASDVDAEARFLALINTDRSAAGVGELSVSDDLTQLAREHAAEMAANGDTYHVRDLGSRVSNWKVVGDNVGRGSSVDEVHDIFMSSDAHRHNIVDARFSQVGIGVEWRDGSLYVTQIFRDPVDATTTTTTTTTTTPPRPRRTSTAGSPTTTSVPPTSTTTTAGARAEAETPPPTAAPTTTAVAPAMTTPAPPPTLADQAALVETPTMASPSIVTNVEDEVEDGAERHVAFDATSRASVPVDRANALLACTAVALGLLAVALLRWSDRYDADDV